MKIERYYTRVWVASFVRMTRILVDIYAILALYGGDGAKVGEAEDKDTVFESGGGEGNAGTS